MKPQITDLEQVKKNSEWWISQCRLHPELLDFSVARLVELHEGSLSDDVYELMMGLVRNLRAEQRAPSNN